MVHGAHRGVRGALRTGTLIDADRHSLASVGGERERAPDSRVFAAIVNYRGADRTLRTAASVVPELRDDRGTLAIIDSCSGADDLAALDRGRPPGVAVVALPANRGYAAACNVALGLAEDTGATYVWLLNNDLEILPGALARLVDALERDPGAAAAAPVTISNDRATVLGAGMDLDMRIGRVRHRFMGRDAGDLPPSSYPVDAIEGSAPLVRLDAVRRGGAWDETYFMYWEDAEWSVRIRRHGFRLLVVPGARVAHETSASSTPAMRVEYMLANRVKFMHQVGSRAQLAIFVPYFVGLWLPAYTAVRLVPRFGVRRGLLIAWRTVVRSARELGLGQPTAWPSGPGR